MRTPFPGCRETMESMVGARFFARSLSSLFTGPERILRRFYVFAEEPCKSTITTS